MMDRNSWMASTIAILQQFASDEYQERVWRRGDGPEVSSFEEAYNHFFDDCMAGGQLAEEWKDLGLSEIQWNLINTFARKLNIFGEMVPDIPKPEEVLDNPGLESVRVAAKHALESLKQ